MTPARSNCYQTDDDVGSPITADQLQIADDVPDLFLGTDFNLDTITLAGNSNGVGIDAVPVDPEGAGGVPDVTIPIVLGADQTWQIESDNPSLDGLEVDDVSQSGNYNLDLQLGGSFTQPPWR